MTSNLTSRSLPNGVVTTSQYDGLNRLTRLTHAKTGNTLADFQYQFDAVSTITQMMDVAGTHNYTYDTRDRLTAVTHPNQTNETYTLDDVGNRTASHQGSSYTYQSFNRLTAANSNTYAYNANGNLTSTTNASGSWTYTWDFENRLKQAIQSGGVTITYDYDALGRRVQRTSNTGGTTKFVYEGADVLRDLDGTGNTTADYLNGPGTDNKLRQTSGGSVVYFIQDHLGTTRGLVDASGAVISNLAYDSYGNVTNGTPLTRYTYTGREFDTDTQTGLIYYRARWYDPQQGRLISEDPAGIEAGVNLYAYVENDPVGSSDPFGLIRYPKSRLRWGRCNREDWAYCERECGPRGVKSCRVREIFKIRRIKSPLAEWAWIRLQPSCNCNEECDNKKVPEPIPVIVPKPNTNTGPKPVPIPFWVPRFFTIPIIMVDPCLVYPELCSGQRT